MCSVLVILDEQQQLLEEQREILDKNFYRDWKILSVPFEGWTLAEIKGIIDNNKDKSYVFATPVPAMMSLLSTWSTVPHFKVFHKETVWRLV